MSLFMCLRFLSWFEGMHLNLCFSILCISCFFCYCLQYEFIYILTVATLIFHTNSYKQRFHTCPLFLMFNYMFSMIHVTCSFSLYPTVGSPFLLLNFCFVTKLSKLIRRIFRPSAIILGSQAFIIIIFTTLN